MRLSRNLLLAGAASHATAISYPTEMGLDVVFPGNGTYKNVTEMPIIFALRNADAAFLYGYTIAWHIEKASTSKNVVSGGMPYGNIIESGDSSAPTNAVNNIWYATDSVDKYNDLPAGDYSLRWQWIMTICNASQSLTTYRPSRTVASGSVNFSLADDGASMALTKDCPVFLTQFKVTGVSSGNCPHVANSDEKHDACTAKMSQDMETCVLANLTETSDNDACSKLVRTEDDEDDDSSSGNSSDTNGNSTSSSGGSSSSDKDNSGTMTSVSTFWTTTILATIAGALLF